jgi:hypothetical protein
MRLVSFILFSVIALASSAPSAFAAENAFGRASLSSATCPVYEGSTRTLDAFDAASNA